MRPVLVGRADFDAAVCGTAPVTCAGDAHTGRVARYGIAAGGSAALGPRDRRVAGRCRRDIHLLQPGRVAGAVAWSLATIWTCTE